jgi:hypothetical protein
VRSVSSRPDRSGPKSKHWHNVFLITAETAPRYVSRVVLELIRSDIVARQGAGKNASALRAKFKKQEHLYRAVPRIYRLLNLKKSDGRGMSTSAVKKKKGGKALGTQKFTERDETRILSIVEEVLPIGGICGRR